MAKLSEFEEITKQVQRMVGLTEGAVPRPNSPSKPSQTGQVTFNTVESIADKLPKVFNILFIIGRK
jgi:hypothetical protein